MNSLIHRRSMADPCAKFIFAIEKTLIQDKYRFSPFIAHADRKIPHSERTTGPLSGGRIGPGLAKILTREELPKFSDEGPVCGNWAIFRTGPIPVLYS